MIVPMRKPMSPNCSVECAKGKIVFCPTIGINGPPKLFKIKKKDKKMSIITSAERVSIKKGRIEGMIKGKMEGKIEG